MKLIFGVIEIKGISFLMFSVSVVSIFGYLLGRITIKGINLGTSGVFLTSLLYGALFSDHMSSTIVQASIGQSIDISTNALKIIENIGLIFFIGAVGFISGPRFFIDLKKNFKSSIILGIIIILSGALTCIICFYIGKASGKEGKEFVVMMVGIFAGALTSTPAFSATKATADDQYESAVTVGYGIAYLFGVVGVVFFVQLVPKILKTNMEIEKKILLRDDNNISSSLNQNRQEIQGSKIEYEGGVVTTEQGDFSSRPQTTKTEERLQEKNVEIKKEEKIKTKDHLTLSIKENVKNEKKENEVIIEINENKENKEYEMNKTEIENKKIELTEDQKKEGYFIIDPFGFCVFSFGVLFGIFIGAIKIPLSDEGLNGSAFSLTNTGGILIVSLVIGHFGKIGKLSLSIEKKNLEVFRELGLFLFLVGTGISGGAKFVEYFRVVYFFYGIFITLIPLFVGFLFGKYILKLGLLNNLGSITGGMTSTPALGTLINLSKCNEVGGSYASTYPISLISVVLASQFMVLLLK